MKKIVIAIIVFLFVVSGVKPSVIFAQEASQVAFIASASSEIEYNLPFPGILPTHPMYFLKQLRDKILIFFTRDPIGKSKLHLLLADKNLVMGHLLWEQQNYQKSVNTLEIAEKYLVSSILDLTRSEKPEDTPPGDKDKIKLAIDKHKEVIEKLILSSSNETKSHKLNQILSITHQARQQIDVFK